MCQHINFCCVLTSSLSLAPSALSGSALRPLLDWISGPQTVSVSPRVLWGALDRPLRRVVPPDAGFPALLFELQRAELLLPALLAVPQLLAVLVHAQSGGRHRVLVLVAPLRRSLQPAVPVTGKRRVLRAQVAEEAGRTGGTRLLIEMRVVGVEGVLGPGRVEAVVGNDVEAVAGQDLPVRVLMAGAGIEARVGPLQALDQQPPLHVDGASVVRVRELRREGRV